MRFSPRGMILALLAGAACGLAACTGQPGMISADAISGSVEAVCARHNALVNASTTYSDLEKRTYTRTADLLVEMVHEAQKAKPAASPPAAEQIDGNNSTRTLAPPDTSGHQSG